MPYGVTANGLSLPNLTDILDDVSAQQKGALDPNLDTSPESPVGQFNAIYLATVRGLLETIQIAHDGFDPDAAEDFLLEGVSAITGTIKAGATSSRFTLTAAKTGQKVKVTLKANKTILPGVIFAQLDNTSVQFVTTESVESTTAGDYYVAARCLTTGPVTCNAGTLTVIITPVSGLDAVTNDYDAILGRNVDTDQELRARRENELHQEGGGPVDAIAAKLFAITLDDESKPIIDCSVVENATDYPDSLGRPPHSIEALIYDGDDQDCPDDTIAQTLWDAKPGGIPMYGYTDSGTAVDTAGASHVVKFNRATLRPVKIRLDIETGPKYAGDDALKSALVHIFLGTRERMGVSGRKVKWADVATVIDRGALGGVTGVVNIVSIQIAFVGSAYPSSFVDLAIGPRDMPTLDTSDIEIT